MSAAPARPSFSIGIEAEDQTLAPSSRDLRSHSHAEIVQQGKTLLAERVKIDQLVDVTEALLGSFPLVHGGCAGGLDAGSD